MSIYWIVLFLIFLFVELITINLVSIWFALGSVAAFLASFITDSIIVQLLVFIIFSIICLLFTLPVIKKIKTKNKIIPTNIDRVIGKKGEVIKEIKPNHYGEVEVFGKIWTATSDNYFKVGDRVVVVAIDGVKLVVKKEEEN